MTTTLTAPGGYPSRSWGAGGFAGFLISPGQARIVVRGLAGDGVDVVKLAVERGPDGAWPVPSRCTRSKASMVTATPPSSLFARYRSETSEGGTKWHACSIWVD